MERIENQVQAQLEKWPEWQQSQRVLIAVSGGIDSVVLLSIIYQLNQRLEQPKELIVAHFNHHLRNQSDVDAQFVRELAQQYQLVYYLHEWENPAQRNIEANAREARYQFFAEIIMRESIDVLLTGHHLNDLAETRLMRLTRGTSVRGLRGIDANYRRLLKTGDGQGVYVQMIRPLLHLPKEQIVEYANRQQLLYMEDETNTDTKYFRNRMRHQLLPAFMQENPNFLESVLALQKQLQASYQVNLESYLQEEPKLLMYSARRHWVLYIPSFLSLSESRRQLYLAIFFEERLIDDVVSYTKESLERVEQLMLSDRLPNGSFQLNDQWIVRREYDYLYIQPVNTTYQSSGHFACQINLLNHWYYLNEHEQIGLFEERQIKTSQVLEMDYALRLYLRPDQLNGFYVRHRQNGDRLTLNDQNGDVFHKKVSRYLIDSKIPTQEREQLWLLCDRHQQVISISGHISARHYRKRQPGTQTYLFLYRKIQD